MRHSLQTNKKVVIFKKKWYNVQSQNSWSVEHEYSYVNIRQFEIVLAKQMLKALN